MTPLFADAGVPMVFLEYPIMLAALIPVIAAEIIVARKMFKPVPRRAIKAIITANVFSTVLGFPLLWFLLFIMQLLLGGGRSYGLETVWNRVYAVTIQAPWLVPSAADADWSVPIAAVYLLVPAFFASVYVERWICSWYWHDQDREQVRKFSWVAHFVSYAVLLAVAAICYAVLLKKAANQAPEHHDASRDARCCAPVAPAVAAADL